MEKVFSFSSEKITKILTLFMLMASSKDICKINFEVSKIHISSGYFQTFSRTKILKVSKGAKIRNRYNQVPHLTQDIKPSYTLMESSTDFHEIIFEFSKVHLLEE